MHRFVELERTLGVTSKVLTQRQRLKLSREDVT
ncbi:hypothetical protein [Pseudofrankia sp. DC12]